jgi:hypothetical protein
MKEKTMRFIASIHYQDACIARNSVTHNEGQTPEQVADAARECLVRDANRTRTDVLTDSALDGIADAFREASLRHAESGEKGDYTCVARLQKDGTHAVSTMPGGFATLTQKGDLMAHLRIMSDADVAENDAFVDRIMQSA